MKEQEWLSSYFESYKKVIFQPELYGPISEFAGLLNALRSTGKKAIFVGNGGSAAMASHAAVDLTKTAGIRAINFNEADLITCYANDYGYEQWVLKALESYADEGDLVVLISSSGKSPNIVNAARYAVTRGLKLVTFSGFSSTNPLRSLGSLNFWVNSDSYNIVENSHLVWILSACDMAIAKAAGQISNEPAAQAHAR